MLIYNGYNLNLEPSSFINLVGLTRCQYNSNPFNMVPVDLLSAIFSCLNLAMLGKGCLVCKKWNWQLANDSILWKHVIYKDRAIGPEKWLGTIEMDTKENCLDAFSSLLPNIIETLKQPCSAFLGEYVINSNMLVWLPKGLSLDKLGQLLKKHFSQNLSGYAFIHPQIRKGGDIPTNQSGWVLTTMDVLRGSKRGIGYLAKEGMVADLARKTQIPYEISHKVELVASIIAKYVNSGICLFGRKPLTYTYTKEEYIFGRTIVGGFGFAGLRITVSVDHLCIGVAAAWRCNF